MLKSTGDLSRNKMANYPRDKYRIGYGNVKYGERERDQVHSTRTPRQRYRDIMKQAMRFGSIDPPPEKCISF